MIQIRIDNYTYLFLLLAFLSGFINDAIIILLIVFLHEMGHVLLSIIFKNKVVSITLYPFGGITRTLKPLNEHNFSDILIILGGIISQILIQIVSFFLYTRSLMDPYFYQLISKYNISILLFNLIPIVPLDGYLLVNHLLKYIFSFKRAYHISFYLSVVMLVIFTYVNHLLGYDNYLILGFLMFKTIEYLKVEKIIYNKFLLERYLYNYPFNHESRIQMNSIDNLYINRREYFWRDNKWVSERAILAKTFDK